MAEEIQTATEPGEPTGRPPTVGLAVRQGFGATASLVSTWLFAKFAPGPLGNLLDWLVRGEFVVNGLGPFLMWFWDRPLVTAVLLAGAAIGYYYAALRNGWPLLARFPFRAYALTMFALTGVALLAAEVPAVPEGQLSVQIREALAPMALRQGDNRRMVAVYALSLRNEGGAPVELQEVALHVEAPGTAGITLGDCPPAEVGEPLRISTGDSDSVTVVIGTDKSIRSRVGSRIATTDSPDVALVCVIDNPAVAPTLVTGFTRHSVRIRDGNGHTSTSTILWPPQAFRINLRRSVLGSIATEIEPPIP